MAPVRKRFLPLRVLQNLLLLAIALILLTFCFAFYAFKIEPDWVQVTRVQVPIAQLPPAFQGYRIVQISDLHVDEWMTAARLRQVVAIANRQQPDLLALTGDFVTQNPEQYAATLTEVLQELQPRDQTVAVLGNHDHWQNPEITEKALRAAGITVLNNAVETLDRDRSQLAIAGLDDYWVGATRLEPVLEQLPAQVPAILLIHEPDFADTSAATQRFALQLSGHSHGGQVRIPFWGPPILPPLGQKYPAGRYQVGNMMLYTNRGVGAVKPRVRFNSRPEITVFSLTGKRGV